MNLAPLSETGTTSEKRDRQVVLAGRSSDLVELLRQIIEIVDVFQDIIIFIHHRRNEASTKKEIVR